MDLILGDYLQPARIFFLSTIDFFHEFEGFFLQVHKNIGTDSFF